MKSLKFTGGYSTTAIDHFQESQFNTTIKGDLSETCFGFKTDQ